MHPFLLPHWLGIPALDLWLCGRNFASSESFGVVPYLRCESQAQPVRCDFEQADFSRFDAGRRDFVMFGVDVQFLAGKWQRLSHSQ
jgi:hypothetical protein